MRPFLLFILLLLSLNAQALVLSSIKPIDLIVKDITGGEIGSFVLLDGSSSPHHYALTVSDARKLVESDLFLWVGPELESFLVKPLQKRTSDTLSLLTLDAFRTRHDEQEKAEHHDHEGHDHHHDHAGIDAHVWLSYQNAIEIARSITHRLSIRYPSDKALFESRLKHFVETMMGEKQATAALFAQLKNLRFGVYHDGYSAYVREFGLNQSAHVTLAPDEQLSMKTLIQLKRELGGAQCLLGESAEWSTVERVANKLDIRPVAIDLLASDVERSNTPDHFLRYMRNVRQSFLSCLGSSGE